MHACGPCVPRRVSAAGVWLALVLGCGAMATTGCGPATATVEGTVTLDGQPVDGGAILLAPAEGEGPSVTAPIVAGHYALTTRPGTMRVQISAPVVVERRKAYEGADAPLIEVTRERLPARYNTQSELTVDLQPGPNTKDWVLSSGQP